jgi:hypothetical protein
LGKPKGKKYYNFVVVGRKREQQWTMTSYTA